MSLPNTEWETRQLLISGWREYMQKVDVAGGLTIGTTSTSATSATISGDVALPSTPSATTINAVVRTLDAHDDRRQQAALLRRTQTVHQTRYIEEWHARCADYAKYPARQMLNTLWKDGFAWRAIARLLDVSVAALQKWRGGETKPSKKNQAKLRDFMAAYVVVCTHNHDIDVPSWLDLPVVRGVPITPMDIWQKLEPAVFFEFAISGAQTPQATLDAYDPNWRARYLDDGFQNVRGEDDRMSIEMTD